jgi:uroporphyrinogen decarboxylase
VWQAEGGHGGGYILSSSSDIIASVKPANYRAMLDTLKEFGTYPLDEERLRD